VLANRRVTWSVGAALVCVILVAGAWFGLIAPRRADAADLHDQQVAAAQAADVLRAKVAQLRAQYAQLPAMQAELARMRLQLTPTADLPTVVRTVSAMSTASGTELLSIIPGAPAAATASGASPGAAAPAGLVAIPLSIVVDGDYYQVVAFLRRVQTEMARALLIGGLQIDQDQGGTGDTVKLSLTGHIFSLPPTTTGTAAAGVTPAASAAGAAASAAAGVSQ